MSILTVLGGITLSLIMAPVLVVWLAITYRVADKILGDVLDVS